MSPFKMIYCAFKSERVCKLRIINGKLLTMDSENYENGYVEFENGKITSFGDMSTFHQGNGECLDAKGGYILPGFIDAHCHIGIGPESTGSPEYFETIDPITPHFRGIDAIYPFDTAMKKAMSAGVTSVVAGPGSTNIIDGQLAAFKLSGDRVKDMIIKAPCAMKIALGNVPKLVFGGKGKAPATRMAIAAMLRETLLQARTYMNKVDSGDDIPFNIKYDALIPVFRREIPMHVHASRTDDMVTAIEVAKEFNLRCVIIHGNEAEDIIDVLKSENISVILGPMIFASRSNESRGSSFKTPKALQDAGVQYAICTDHCPNMVSTEFLPVCASLAAREGLSDMEALASITINPARILGIDNRIGSIAIGKDADISVFNGHPLEFTSKPSAVFINGSRVI